MFLYFEELLNENETIPKIHNSKNVAFCYKPCFITDDLALIMNVLIHLSQPQLSLSAIYFLMKTFCKNYLEAKWRSKPNL